MKIIPMMAVLICASDRWHHGPLKASALELPIPGLGRMKLEFQPDTTSHSPADGVSTEGDESETTLSNDPHTEAPTDELSTSNATTEPEPKASNPTEATPAVTKEQKENTTKSTTPVNNGNTTTTEAPPKDKQTDASPDPETTAKDISNETSDPDSDQLDDFNDSDIWDDTEDPPNEFGREYDLDPDLLDSGGNDFQPKLELPPDMTKDMFYDSPTGESSGEPDGDDNQAGGLFERFKRFFSISNIKEELDTIPGKIQNLVDRFQQKKAEGLMNLRDKMDESAEKVGKQLSEVFSKLKQRPEECVEQIEQLYTQYEAAMQDGIQPCLDKVQSVTKKQEENLRAVHTQFTKMLTSMQDCVNMLDSSSLNTLFKSILNMGRCTKNNIQSKIQSVLQPQMKRLSEMVQQQSSKLMNNMNAAGSCVERRLKQPKLQMMQQELIEQGVKCSERRA